MLKEKSFLLLCLIVFSQVLGFLWLRKRFILIARNNPFLEADIENFLGKGFFPRYRYKTIKYTNVDDFIADVIASRGQPENRIAAASLRNYWVKGPPLIGEE